MFFGIGSSEGWLSAEPVKKGWSKDEKYLVRDGNGRSLLLRLSDIERADAKRREFEMIRKFAGTGVRMSEPIEFGVCEGGSRVFMLLTWLEGRDLESVLSELPEDEQYLLGREAGRILKSFHSIPLEKDDIPTVTKREKKLDQLARYEASSVRVPGDEPVFRFVRENIGAIWRTPPTYLHGDFHPGNLIFQPDGGIGVIDFNRWEVGDPYEEFYKLESFGREVSIPYARGQISAYFNDIVPEEFWEALAVYSAHASLYSVKWAEQFGQKDIDGMVRRYHTAMEDFDGFTRVVPKWFDQND